jgi:hypothetical protein
LGEKTRYRAADGDFNERAAMVSLRDWVNNWRDTEERLAESERVGIIMRHGGNDYEVLTVRAYDAEIDEGRKLARTVARAFDNQVALYSRRTRDSGLARVITKRGTPYYVLERGPGALEWAAAVEGMSIPLLVAATREGALGLGLSRNRRRLQRTREDLEEIVEALSARKFDAEQEADELQTELKAVEFELEVLIKRQKNRETRSS